MTSSAAIAAAEEMAGRRAAAIDVVCGALVEVADAASGAVGAVRGGGAIAGSASPHPLV